MLEIKKVFRPYVMASVNNVERWLSAMSENGWTLYGVHRWVFTFRKSAPKHKEFFVYWTPDKSATAFTNFFRIERRYKKSGRDISTSGICFFEVDPSKIDAMSMRNKNMRNKYFLNYNVQLLIAALFVDVIEVLLFFHFEEIGRTTFSVLFVFFSAAVVYFFVSVILLYREHRKISKRL